MKNMCFILIAILSLWGCGGLSAQVTFVQSSTDDFSKGTGFNVNIANDCVSLQQKMSSLNDWEAASNLPQNLINHQIVIWRDYVYCVGGNNGSQAVNTVYRADQYANGLSNWSTMNTLPVALQDVAAAVTQTQLVVLGGRNNDGVSDKIYVAPFNGNALGTWSELDLTLPQPLWGAKAVTVLDNIYIMGGASSNSENDASDKVYCLKLNAAGEIVNLIEETSLPEARNGHAVATYDSKIYVTGGYDSSHAVKSTVYYADVQLDGTLGSWQQQTSLPVTISNHTTVCSNGIITIMGG